MGYSHNRNIIRHKSKLQFALKHLSISDQLLVSILETGQVKPKPQQANAFWAFADIAGRTDNPQMDNPWFNLQAAAAMLGISERTLQRRIEVGVIKPKKVGREYQLTPKDLEKLKKAD